MKITLNWLKQYLETNKTLEEICQALTNIGLEVESCKDKSQSLKPFFVAEIIEAEAVENSNKLKKCLVKINETQLLQVVCGAKNARKGIKVAFAPIGALIPANQMIIKKAKIAGIESSGMICSASELLLGEEGEGIIEIDYSIPIGKSIAEVYGINDAEIEINITPNRGDCLAILGIARDLAGAGIGSLKNNIHLFENFNKNCCFDSPIKLANIDNFKKTDFNFTISNNTIIENDNQDKACHFAGFRYINHLENKKSPQWLQDQLTAVGVRSISAMVDIANWVMISLNHPLHIYDANKIDGEINIGFANNGDKFTSLNQEEYQLNNSDIIISDKNKNLALAGIIGGISSSCSAETKEIIIEGACFDNVMIANSGRRINVNSDARYRFERIVDDKNILSAIQLASLLILEICGTKNSQVSDIKTIGDYKKNLLVNFDISQVKRLTGVDISSSKIIDILEKLEIKMKNQLNESLIQFEIPSFRSDISNSQDLVEEVIRFFGYNNIKSQPLIITKQIKNLNIVDKLKSYLANNSMIETVNWSFIDEKTAENFGVKTTSLLLENPISSEMNYMRTTLAIGLLNSYQKNYLRNFVDLSIFEVGNVFLDEKNYNNELMLAGLRVGGNNQINHFKEQRNFDVFDVKKDIFSIFEILGINQKNLTLDNTNVPPYFHPYRASAILLGKTVIGYFGELHPNINKLYDIKPKFNYFEVFLDKTNYKNLQNKQVKAIKINDLQAIERDFAFIVDKSVAIGDVIRNIENVDKNYIKKVELFDIYQDQNLGEAIHSLAFKVLMQPVEKTFTSEDIEKISNQIIDSVVQNYSAKLR
ncbi:MAG: phenylalanine--tRNA ligase subunit beta [Rickettsiales bacterium]|nr:phenylalanine--tRNA ligase subunit beta [Rickettsiales bacterium]